MTKYAYSEDRRVSETGQIALAGKCDCTKRKLTRRHESSLKKNGTRKLIEQSQSTKEKSLLMHCCTYIDHWTKKKSISENRELVKEQAYHVML